MREGSGCNSKGDGCVLDYSHGVEKYKIDYGGVVKSRIAYLTE